MANDNKKGTGKLPQRLRNYLATLLGMWSKYPDITPRDGGNFYGLTLFCHSGKLKIRAKFLTLDRSRI